MSASTSSAICSFLDARISRKRSDFRRSFSWWTAAAEGRISLQNRRHGRETKQNSIPESVRSSKKCFNAASFCERLMERRQPWDMHFISFHDASGGFISQVSFHKQLELLTTKHQLSTKTVKCHRQQLCMFFFLRCCDVFFHGRILWGKRHKKTTAFFGSHLIAPCSHTGVSQKPTSTVRIWYLDTSAKKRFAGWWFQIFFICTPIWGNDPILTTIFEMGGSTTN